jgi:putative FmdB family regulatory protein
MFCIKGLHKGLRMPIYAYRCRACGHEKDVLQKLSDSPLTACPSCGAEAFSKQLTAAGFQLKGSGWYATDFKGAGSKPSTEPAKPSGPAESPAAAGDTKPSGSDGSAAVSGGCGASCACH